MRNAAFLAPEISRDFQGMERLHEIGCGVDIFALGVTFFIMMYGTETKSKAWRFGDYEETLHFLFDAGRGRNGERRVIPPQDVWEDAPETPSGRRTLFLKILEDFANTRRCTREVVDFIIRATEYVPANRWSVAQHRREASIFKELVLTDGGLDFEDLRAVDWEQLLRVDIPL